LREGDVLSFTIVSAQPGYAAVISRAPDGVQVYVPLEAVPAGTTLLRQAAELDGSRGEEVLYLLFGPRKVDLDDARRAIEADPSLRRWGEVEIEQRRFSKP
jgi:hypothetical protein